MAFDPANLIRASEDDAPDAAGAPLNGTRAQTVQRLQVGLFGLGAMILLIGLANIILTNARENEARVVPEAASTVAASPSPTPTSDPLADAGVVPIMPEEEPPQEAPAPGAGAEAARPGSGETAVDLQ